ncbi:ABC transporter permease [Candidatus Cloacimonadota bacterium]
MISQNLLNGFRQIKKNKLNSTVNIIGLGVSLATCLLILIWVINETNYDKFHENISQIYRVNLRDVTYEEHHNYSSTPPPLARAILQDFPEVEYAVHFATRTAPVKVDETLINASLSFTSKGFFDIFSFKTLSGNSDDVFDNPYSVMLTENMAEKLFSNGDAIGKTIQLYDEYIFTVVGIIQDYPSQSSIDLELITSFTHLEELTGNGNIESWNLWGFATFILLNEKTERSEFDAVIKDYVTTKDDFDWEPELYLQPFSEIHLHDINGGGQIVYVSIFSIIALFVLIIACINFINLATAQSTLRIKEIGLRKVVGASRKKLVIQLLTESFILVLISLLFALLIVELSYPYFTELTGQQIARSELISRDFMFILIAVGLVVGIISGLYPALYLSSIKPFRAFKQMPNSSSSILRKILIIFQFSISIFLIISTLVVYKQVQYMNNRQLGFDTEHILYIPLNKQIHSNYTNFKIELLGNPKILQSTLTSDKIGLKNMGSLDLSEWEGNNGEKQILVNILSVHYNFVETFGLSMVDGDFFSDKMSSNESGIVFNETAIKAMGLEDPIGKRSLDNLPIIGVIKDFNFESLHTPIEPLIFLFEPDWLSFVVVKLQGDELPETIEFIKQKYEEFSPGSRFEYQFADDAFDRLYRSEQRMGKMFAVFSIVAIVLSSLGLFALSLFMVQRRLKEIGIRKVLGSSVNSILILLSASFVKWVLIAFLISAPIAYYLLNKWLMDYAYRITIDVWIFLASGGIALLIALVTVGLQTYKGANANPAEILKNE